MDYQKRFNWLAVKYLPHHAALKLAIKLHIRPFVGLLNKFAAAHIVDEQDVVQFEDDELAEYTRTISQTKYWHGTGRYQHANGGAIDVLDEIIKGQGLVPSTDVYAIFHDGRPAKSLSLTRLRIIARSYADTHVSKKPANRYGSALLWAAYYYNLFYVRAMLLGTPQYVRSYKKWKQHAYDENGHVAWGKKVNKNARTVWDVFGLGSDIPGNYPIVIGVSKVKNQVAIKKPFSQYEVRTTSAISLSVITHIEVPLDYIEATQTKLSKTTCSIKIYPLELGEFYNSRQSFSAIVDS